MVKRKFNKSFASVYSRDGMHFLIMPSGEHVPHLISTTTTSAVGKDGVVDAVCKFELIVNIVSDKNEALKNYKKTGF